MIYEKGNYFQVPNRKQLMELDGMSIAVYTMLCARADEGGKCFPSLTRLAKDAGVGRNTVVRRINLLEEKGLLRIEHGNHKMSNRYQLLVAEGNYPSARENLPSAREGLGVVPEGDSNDNHITSINNDNHLTICNLRLREDPDTELVKSLKL